MSAQNVRSIERATEILEAFAHERVIAMGPTELARKSRMPKSTVIRLCQTLESLGYLWADSSGRFLPGPALLQWGTVGERAWQVSADLQRTMEAIRDITGETVNLYVRHGLHRVGVAQVESQMDLRHVVRLGERQELSKGSASRVLLAHAPAKVEGLVLEDLGEDEAAEIRTTLEVVRDRGYAISHGERAVGVTGTYVPLRDFGTARVVAALGVAGPTSRIPQEVAERHATLLHVRCRQISGAPATGT